VQQSREVTYRATAQAVSRRLPTAAAQVRSQVRSCGICGGQSGTEAGFLRIFRFLLPILILQTALYSSSCIIRGWYNRQNSGRRAKWTLSYPSSRNLKKRKFRVDKTCLPYAAVCGLLMLLECVSCLLGHQGKSLAKKENGQR
jgi:hypothetical protein